MKYVCVYAMRVLSGVISDDLADTLVTHGSQKHRLA